MPPEAKVAVFEDDNSTRQILKIYLEELGGHQVISEAASMSEAERIIPILGEQGIEVAIIDGNLTKGVSSGADGEKINRLIKELFPNIRTIGNSLNLVEGVDINVGKGNIKNLSQIVTEL